MAGIKEAIEAARAEGYSDADIAAHLMARDEFKAAMAEGYSPSEVLGYWGIQAKPEDHLGQSSGQGMAPQKAKPSVDWNAGAQLGSGAVGGYGPQVAGAAAATKQAIKDVAGGAPVGATLDRAFGSGGAGGTYYAQARDAFSQAKEAYGAARPGTALALEVGGSLPTAMLGSAGVSAGLKGAGEALPASKGVTNFLTGQAGLNALGRPINSGGNALLRYGSKVTEGAREGAEAGLLTSGIGQGDLGQQAGMGAGIGAAVAGVSPLAKYMGGLGKEAWQRFGPMTQGGANKLAHKILAEEGAPVVSETGEFLLRPDLRQLVPGSEPTLAEATGNTGVATLQRHLARNPQNAQLFFEREAAQQAARDTAMAGVAGTKADLQTAKEALAQLSPDHLWASSGAVDASPVLAKVDEILNGASGDRKAIETVFKDLRARLTRKGEILELAPGSAAKPIFDPHGIQVGTAPAQAAQTMDIVRAEPEWLYQSIRRHIGDLMSGKAQDADAAKAVVRELAEVRKVLDDTIDQGTGGGFSKWLSDYRSEAEKINAMEWLQGLNLTDPKGNFSLAKVKNALDNLEKQANLPGARDAKAVRPEQKAMLQAVYEDLLRGANKDLGKKAGTEVGEEGAARVLEPVSPEWRMGIVGGGLGMGMGHPEIGAATGAALGRVLHGMAQNKAQAVENQLMRMMLDPSQVNVGRLKQFGGPVIRTGLANPLISATTPTVNERVR